MERPPDPDQENVRGQAPEDDGPYIELTPEQERDVDHLVDTGQAAYGHAIFQVTGQRVVRRAIEEAEAEAPKEPAAPKPRPKRKRRWEKPLNPALSPREREMADRRPDLKPGLPRLAPDSQYGPAEDEE